MRKRQEDGAAMSDPGLLGVGVQMWVAACRRERYLCCRISAKLHEALQTIREEKPIALGAVICAYHGDIETIVAKVLEKDKALELSV